MGIGYKEMKMRNREEIENEHHRVKNENFSVFGENNIFFGYQNSKIIELLLDIRGLLVENQKVMKGGKKNGKR